MVTWHLGFLIAALVVFIVAAVGYNPPRGSLIAAGLAAFIASQLVSC